VAQIDNNPFSNAMNAPQDLPIAGTPTGLVTSATTFEEDVLWTQSFEGEGEIITEQAPDEFEEEEEAPDELEEEEEAPDELEEEEEAPDEAPRLPTEVPDVVTAESVLDYVKNWTGRTAKESKSQPGTFVHLTHNGTRMSVPDPDTPNGKGFWEYWRANQAWWGQSIKEGHLEDLKPEEEVWYHLGMLAGEGKSIPVQDIVDALNMSKGRKLAALMADNPKLEGNTFEVYQGTGRTDKASAYSEGAKGPILGEAGYYAQTEDQAKIYGPKVERVNVTLENPVYISNTEDLMDFAPPIHGGKIPNDISAINTMMERIREEMDSLGFDGVVVNVSKFDVDEYGNDVKGIARLFGHSQIIQFKKQTEQPAYNPPRVFERQFGSTVNAQDRIDDLKGLKESWKNKEISGEDYKAQLLEVINAPTKAELKERNAEGFTPIQIGVKKEAQKQVNALLGKKLTKTVKPKEEEEAPTGLNLVYEEKLDGSGKKKIQVAKIPGQLIGEYRTQLIGIKKTEKRTGTTYRVVSSDTKALNWNAVPSAPGEHSSEEEALQVLEDFILRYHWDVNPAKFGTQKIKDRLIENAKSYYDESITSEAFFNLKLKELKKLQDRAPFGLPRGNKDQYQENLIYVQNWARKAHGLGPLPEEGESVIIEEIDEAPEEADDAFEDEVVDEKPPVEAPSTIGKDDLKAQKAWLEVYVDEAINNVPDLDTLNDRQAKAVEEFKNVYSKQFGSRQQIHQDIREAMDKLDQYGMLITFDVPGDGIYRILNTKEALEDFKKRIEKFPTATARARKLSKGSGKPKSISSLGTFNQPIVKAVKALQGITSVDQSNSKGFVHTINAGEIVASNGAIVVLIKNTNVPAKSSYDPKTGKKYKAYKLDNEKAWMKHFQNPATKFAGFDTAEMLGILNKIAALQAQTKTETPQEFPSIKFYANEKGWSVESEIFSQVKVDGSYDSKTENQSNYFRQGTEGDYVVSLGLGQFKLLVEAARKSGEQHLSLHLPEKSETDVVDGNPIVIKGKNLQAVIMPLTGDNLPTVKRSAVTDIGSAPLASVEKATLPRGIEAPHYKTGQPVSFTEIRKFLSHSLDIPIRLGVNRMRAHGVFFPRREVIRMKLIDNIPTIAHEVGHYLHFIMFPRMNWMGQLVDPTSRIEGDAFDFAREFDGELKELGRATSRPSYDENQVRKEGVAEFVREFLTDRPNAIKRAPKFHQYFVDTLENNFPEINKILEQATAMIETLVNQSGYDSILSMMQIDGHQMPGEKGNARQTLRKLYTRWVNELAPLERTIKQLERYGLKAPNDQLADQLAINYMGGWLGKVEHTLKQRQIDHEGNDMGPSLEDVLSGVENLTEFQVYLVALRAVEKTWQGKESGLTASHRDEDTNDLIEKFKNFIEENKDKYESHRQKLDKFLTNELIILANAGFITHGEFQRIKEKNEFYVPFHRVHDRVGSIGGGAGKGFIDLSKGGLKGYHGGGGQIVPPLESVVKNLYVQRDLVERNRVGQAFINNINSTFGGGKVADQIVTKIAPTEVRTHEVALQMKKLGLIKITATEETKSLPIEEREYIYTNAETGEVMNPDHFAFTIWRATKTEDAKSGKFSVWFDGKRQYYQVDDPELYKALQLQDSTAAEITSRWPGFATASKFTRTLRAGATLTIDFIQRNPFRDQLQAAVYSKHGFIPFFDGFRGMLSVLGKDKYYWEWIKSGGRYSDFVATDRRDDIVQKLSDVAPDNKMANMKKWLNPIRTLQAMSELMETATRVQEYKLARSQGKSELIAANAAKDVTLNFSRFGWHGKAFNQLFAFYNANVQDWDKLRREHMGPNRGKVMMKSFMYITMPSIFTWWLGHDDERIQNLPWWRKKGFWNINMGQIARMAGNETDSDFVFSLPKPFLLAHLYGTSFESALDYANDRDPNALKKWFVDLVKESPLPWTPFDLEKTYGFNVSTYTPTIARPIYEATADYNIHTKRPLESMALKQLPTHMRYHPNTSELMKLVASTANNLTDNGVNLSPIKLDNFVRAWLGGLGREGVNIADFFLVKWGLADVPPAPKLTVAEYPGVRAFTVSPYEPSDKIRQFYEATKLVEQRMAGLRAADISAATKQNTKEAQRAAPYLLPMGGNLEGANRMTMLRKARTMLSNFSKAMQRVQTDRNMTPEEKTKQLIQFKNQRDKLAETYIKLFEPYDLQRVR